MTRTTDANSECIYNGSVSVVFLIGAERQHDQLVFYHVTKLEAHQWTRTLRKRCHPLFFTRLLLRQTRGLAGFCRHFPKPKSQLSKGYRRRQTTTPRRFSSSAGVFPFFLLLPFFDFLFDFLRKVPCPRYAYVSLSTVSICVRQPRVSYFITDFQWLVWIDRTFNWNQVLYPTLGKRIRIEKNSMPSIFGSRFHSISKQKREKSISSAKIKRSCRPARWASGFCVCLEVAAAERWHCTDSTRFVISTHTAAGGIF